MIIINLSLSIMFLCFSFIAINPKIKVGCFAKLILCTGMISITGALSNDLGIAKELTDEFWYRFLFPLIAFLFSYACFWLHKNGGYKK